MQIVKIFLIILAVICICLGTWLLGEAVVNAVLEYLATTFRSTTTESTISSTGYIGWTKVIFGVLNLVLAVFLWWTLNWLDKR